MQIEKNSIKYNVILSYVSWMLERGETVEQKYLDVISDELAGIVKEAARKRKK